METKEVKIEVPEGYEVDKENSTFECIKFKPIKKCYRDVAEELFIDKETYYINTFSSIESFSCDGYRSAIEGNNCTSKQQAEKLIAINKMMNVAKYLKGKNKGNEKCFLYLDAGNKIDYSYDNSHNERMVYFDCRESALEVVEILGEETIRTALSTDW